MSLRQTLFLWCLPALATAAVESLPDTRINGVAIEIKRFDGDDVAGQVTAVETQWRKEGTPVLPWQDIDGWQVLARQQGRWSEVLQRRGQAGMPEAYLTRLDFQRKPTRIPQLPLPSGCRATSTIESGSGASSVIQVTGVCLSAALALSQSWISDLEADGWRGRYDAHHRTHRFVRDGREFITVFGNSNPSGPSGGLWVVALLKPATAGGSQ